MPGVRCDARFACSVDGLPGFRVPILLSRTDFNPYALIQLSFVVCITELLFLCTESSCTLVIYPTVVQSPSYCRYYYVILMRLQSWRYDAEEITGRLFFATVSFITTVSFIRTVSLIRSVLMIKLPFLPPLNQ